MSANRFSVLASVLWMLTAGCGSDGSAQPSGGAVADAQVTLDATVEDVAPPPDATDEPDTAAPVDSEAPADPGGPEPGDTLVDDAAGADDAGDPDTGAALPTFERVWTEVLVAAGCTASTCHGAGAGYLNMPNAEAAHANLVGVGAFTKACGLKLLIAPGEPTQSILYRRIQPQSMGGSGDCGSKMPKGLDGVSEAQAQLVFDWIAAGATK